MKLINKIEKEGFERVIERIAYTWFNRFLALRFMEIHSYLGHGYRVLSNSTGRPTPEILENADRVQFGSLNKDRVIELKLAGDRDPELYSMLLVAQCNELHKSMPFLFEAINDETELLLPDNLLHTDSIIRKLVNEIPEEYWEEVEIIGWIYQFYISEKKDQVIGKVVKSEDIPAATQLFTPNWIVKYMVQNSLGRKWLATYPDSNLRSKMEYYIEPAEQTPDVQAKLAEITPNSLEPEKITLMDPACGSGHILVEAYDIFKEIYLERGYRTKDIPKHILEKNLYGLDIDDRAAQLAGFALLMRARKDDSRVLSQPPRLNVMSIQSSEDINASELVNHLYEFDPELDRSAIVELISLFKLGKTVGSLIRIPDNIVPNLSPIKEVIERGAKSSNLFVQKASETLESIIEQATLLSNTYDCVVANPPYMGGKGMNGKLKEFSGSRYPDTKSDLFAMFIERGNELVKPNDFCSMVTMQSWMFLSSYEEMRKSLLFNKTINCMVHMANMVMGIAFGTAVTVFRNGHVPSYVGHFCFVNYEDLNDKGIPHAFPIKNDRLKSITADNFHKIPGSPIAYWASQRFLEIFEEGKSLGSIAWPCIGMRTGDNERFLRRWFEVDWDLIGIGYQNSESAIVSEKKWFPYYKGGGFRKWYGNNDFLVNWYNDGEEIKENTKRVYPYLGDRLDWKISNENCYFKPGITWSFVSSSYFGVRYTDSGFIFDVGGSSAFPDDNDLRTVTGFLCTKLSFDSMKMLNPTLNFQVGNVASLPVIEKAFSSVRSTVNETVEELISISRADWDSFETSWDFKSFPWIITPLKANTTEQSFKNWESHLNSRIKQMMELETENNRLWINAYGLQDELDPLVPEDQITLARPDAEKDVKRLIPYAIGCMMGRYSLDEPGLTYANAGSIDFDTTKYITFRVDDDGILPITDIEWFPDDVTIRFC